MHDAPLDPATLGWSPLPGGGFPAHAGPLWYQPGSDGAAPKFAMLADSRHTNLHGIVHGGMLMTFADRALGRNSWRAAGEKPVATVEFNMHFVTAGKIGEVFEIRPEIVRKTSSLVFIRGDVVSEVDVETTWGIVTSVITTRSVDELQLKPGSDVVALVKSTEVSIAKL